MRWAAFLLVLIWTREASAANAGRLPNACDLMSGIEVQRAAGLALPDSATRVRNGLVTGCTFGAETGSHLMVLVRKTTTNDPWVADQLARMSRAPYRELTRAEGRAFLYDLPREAVLCIFDGGYYVQLSLRGPSSRGGAEGVLNAIAGTMLARLHSAGR